MLRRLGLLIALTAVVPSCKSMGGFASGLGHAASGLGRAAGSVASGVGRAAGSVASGVGHAVPAVASGVAHAVPVVGRGLEHAVPALVRGANLAEAILTSPDVEVDVVEPDAQPEAPVAVAVDPCDACPITVDCGSCPGWGNYACQAVGTRCESTAPPDAPPAKL